VIRAEDCRARNFHIGCFNKRPELFRDPLNEEKSPQNGGIGRVVREGVQGGR